MLHEETFGSSRRPATREHRENRGRAGYALGASPAVQARFPSPRPSGSGRQAAEAPLVSFVIPVKNDAARLARCLKSILASRYPAGRLEIVIADNGSDDGSGRVGREAGRAAGVACRVLSLPGLRVSRLRNAGANAARGRVIAFVDADHEIDPEWVAGAVETLGLKDVAAVGALYHAPADGTWVQRMYDAFRHRPAGREPVEWLGSGNMAVRRDAFNEVHGFDTSLESCEDVDLCQRLRRRGYEVMSDARLRSVHFGDPTTLAALFRQELWRGRDNLRASLRGPLTWRGVPSVLIPVMDQILLAMAVAGVVALPFGGLRLAGLAACCVATLAALRAARMMTQLDHTGLREAFQAFAVASVYDVARALAPLSNASYRLRRPSSEPRGGRWAAGDATRPFDSLGWLGAGRRRAEGALQS